MDEELKDFTFSTGLHPWPRDMDLTSGVFRNWLSELKQLAIPHPVQKIHEGPKKET